MVRTHVQAANRTIVGHREAEREKTSFARTPVRQLSAFASPTGGRVFTGQLVFATNAKQHRITCCPTHRYKSRQQKKYRSLHLPDSHLSIPHTPYSASSIKTADTLVVARERLFQTQPYFYQKPVVPTPSYTPLGSKPVSASISLGKRLLCLPLPPPDEGFGC